MPVIDPLTALTLFQGVNTYEGQPLQGGFIWSYLPGSFSVLAPLYDSGGGELPNPVAINMDGTLQHVLYLWENMGRNLVLTTANGTVISVTGLRLQGS